MTLKEFMSDYPGFDWEHGTLVLVKKSTCHPFIISRAWEHIKDRHLNDCVYSWTNSDDIMVVTVDDKDTM